MSAPAAGLSGASAAGLEMGADGSAVPTMVDIYTYIYIDR